MTEERAAYAAHLLAWSESLDHTPRCFFDFMRDKDGKTCAGQVDTFGDTGYCEAHQKANEERAHWDVWKRKGFR